MNLKSTIAVNIFRDCRDIFVAHIKMENEKLADRDRAVIIMEAIAKISVYYIAGISHQSSLSEDECRNFMRETFLAIEEKVFAVLRSYRARKEEGGDFFDRIISNLEKNLKEHMKA